MRRGFRSVLAAAGAVMLSWSAAAFADVTPSPSPTEPSLPIVVTLGSIRPLAPQPGDTLTVRGNLRNFGSEAVTGLELSLEVSRTKIGSRGEFDGFADDPTAEQPVDAFAPSTEQVVLPRTSLGPSGLERFTVTVPVDDLQLPEAWQVYEMAIVVNGDTTLGHVPVGRLRTFLPWAPLGQSGTGAPARVAWVWPLVDRPHRSDGGAWLDDDLAGSLASGGRLNRLLAAGETAENQQPPTPPKPRRTKHGRKRPPASTRLKAPIQPVPVTWAVDPALVDDVRAMTSGYTVRTSSGTRTGTGKTVAAQWLARLRQDVPATEFFGVPYADPDVTAAAHAGLGHEVQVASTRGDEIFSDPRVFGRSALPYAWPPDGFADQRTLDTYFAAGETTLVLDSTALPVVGTPPSETPSAHATMPSRDGQFQALLSDDTLDQVVNTGAETGADGPLAVQRLLSELLMIQAERPFDTYPRSFVIAPSRRWNPTASYAAALLADTGRVPWVAPVALSDVAKTPVYDVVERGPLVYPEVEKEAQLSGAYLTGVAHTKHLVDIFADIAQPALSEPAGSALARSLDDGVLRSLSSAWRDDPALADQGLTDLQATVQQTMNQVHIASRASSLVTMTSHTGTVPVTVANDLDIPVRVVVRVEPDQHLVVKSGHVVQLIQPHRQIPVDIRATAQTSGVFGLTVQLTTTSGEPYGAPVPLRIRSTAYGTTALLITGSATAVLMIAVIVRLVRRARAARRTVAAST